MVLVFIAIARMLLLSAVVETTNQETISQGRIWTVFILNALFVVGFAASTYGLWGRHHWGRLLFMGCVIVWSLFYIAAQFLPGVSSANRNYTLGALTFNLIPYVVGLLVSVWYLNLPHIKALFDTEEAANE